MKEKGNLCQLAFLDIYGYNMDIAINIQMYNKEANIFRKIDVTQIRIDAFRPLDEQLLEVIQEKLRIEWTYNSNALEGNTLTLGETAFFLREGLTSEGRPLQDYLEARNHLEAILELQDIIYSKRKLTENLIKQLHSLLLADIHHTIALGADGKRIEKPLHAGQYKKRPNHVLTMTGRIHYYTEPIHVKDEMEALLNWYNKESKKLHPIEKAAIFHYRFVAIHPFDDGNGRMARILMNLILMQSGYPPCIIRNVRRRDYLSCLEKIDMNKDFSIMSQFVGEELFYTQQVIIDVIEGKADTEYREEKKSMSKDVRIEKILHILDKELMSIGQIHTHLPFIKRPTLKKDLQELVKENKIRKKGRGKGVVYYH